MMRLISNILLMLCICITKATPTLRIKLPFHSIHQLMVILLLLCINLYYRGYSDSEGKATIPLNTSANGDITIVVYQSVLQRLLQF